MKWWSLQQRENYILMYRFPRGGLPRGFNERNEQRWPQNVSIDKIIRNADYAQQIPLTIKLFDRWNAGNLPQRNTGIISHSGNFLKKKYCRENYFQLQSRLANLLDLAVKSFKMKMYFNVLWIIMSCLVFFSLFLFESFNKVWW